MNFAGFFVHPGFVLSGAALVASPIIIHLINRMRFRRVRFAAMEFLLQSQQRNRRRILIEQLILLLLRILIVLAIMLLIARLIMDPNQLSVIKGTAQSHHLMILDDSGSMQDTFQGTTAFQEAINVAKKLVSRGAENPGTQKFTLLLLSHPHKALFRQESINHDFESRMTSTLENVKCSHQQLDLAKALTIAREDLADEPAMIKYVHVVSDFRKRDWQNQSAILEAIEALDSADIATNFIRAVPERHANIGITELSGNLQTAAIGVPIRLRVGVKNFGESVERDIRLSVVQDGQPLLGKIVNFDKIEAGKELFQNLDVAFATAGKHRLRISLKSDSIGADNTRFLTVNIPLTNRVLIIDGDPSGEGDDSEYIAEALSADPALTGMTAEIEVVDFLRNVRPDVLKQYQSIYMLNVSELDPIGRSRLEQYVREGGGLAWFMGDSVNADSYNRELYKLDSNGKIAGLFPVPLGPGKQTLPDRFETETVPDIILAQPNPVFSILEGDDNKIIGMIRISDYQSVAKNLPKSPTKKWEPDDNLRKDDVITTALLRNRQPLTFEHRLGKGRIFTSLISAGTAWTNWPQNPSYTIFHLELQKHIARHVEQSNLIRVVGQPIEIDVDAAVYTDSVEIVSPDSGGVLRNNIQMEIRENQPDPNRKTEVPSGSGHSYFNTFKRTDQPGIYFVKLKLQQPGGAQNSRLDTQFFAYNFPNEESNMELAETESMIKDVKEIGSDIRFQVQEYGSDDWIEGKSAGQDVRRALLIALVVFLILEQLLAFRLSYHSSGVTEVA